MKKIEIKAKTENQQNYINSINQNKITFCSGPAGTGKTVISTIIGLKGILDKTYEKLIISRPLVQSDYNSGYLPGTLEEKIAPYIRPVMDILEESIDAKELQALTKAKKIEVIPFGYMRGLTFKNSFIIFEECQNCSFEQMILGLTRFGIKCKMVFSGDHRQSDLLDNKQGAFVSLMERLKDLDGVGTVYLDNTDIVREPIVQKILDRLDEGQAQQESSAS